MAFVYIRYRIENYKKWKTAFNDAFEMRKKGGEKSYRVFRSSDDPKEMVLLQEWSSIAGARRFINSKAVQQCMARAGVVGKREIFFLKEVPQADQSVH
ncbi:MAG: antibiotic biosynthesis monooxygenase [Nitrospirae bacterium]|nr:antibiotic biosynthesis monooxygenase [Nitrospirota bacterium]